MTTKKLLQQYPVKRIKPFNGMAITSKVWEDAHEYHRRSQGLHTLFGHGSGILTGLEVIASDPPDTSLYILPGIAVDQAGQIIVLPRPVTYDIGDEIEGLFYLMLSYGESRQRATDSDGLKSAPAYVHDEFAISAQFTLEETIDVELARVKRSSRNSVLRNAQNPVLPGPDEIDLRFRCEVGPAREARIAVSYLGEATDTRSGQGLIYLAQTLNHLGQYRVLVEDNVTIGPDIRANTMVYLVGQGKFTLSERVMTGLHNFVQRGKGTLFIESLDEAAETSFMNFLKARGMALQPLQARHRLLTQPHFFPTPPAGYQTDGKPDIKLGQGVIFSTHNYGLLWQGERRSGSISREEVRSAVEWGENIVTYAVNRRRG